MLDLETLDKKPGAIITQIGAAQFDRNTGDCSIHRFLENVDAESCEAKGMTMSASTVMWWLAQDKKAQESLFSMEPLSIEAALTKFKAWLISLRRDFDDEYRFWCHASFDFPILQAAYEICKIAPIWHYADYIDLRTIVDFSGIKPRNFVQDTDTAHNALSDCLFQIRYAVAGYNRLTCSNKDPDISP